MPKKLLILSILLLFSGLLFADGGGGMSFGYQTTTYPFLENYSVANNNMDLIYYGGYGYGVSRKGFITGGFGFTIMDSGSSSGFAGGFGGIINGIRLLDVPVTISLTSWTGFGGVYTGPYSNTPYRGFFTIFEEIDLEVVLPLMRWFMPTIYAGYQLAGNIIPGRFGQQYFSYTPVIGIRLAWGKFY